MPNLIPLAETDWPALHKLMRARKFPHTPANYLQARPQLRAAKLWGLKQRNELLAGFVFGPPQDGIAFFDAVCAASAEGHWATRPLLRNLFAEAFGPAPKGLGLRALWVQPHGARALRACLAAGFQPVTPLKVRDGSPPVLVITPHLVRTKLKIL
jgi:hypothetical protein